MTSKEYMDIVVGLTDKLNEAAQVSDAELQFVAFSSWEVLRKFFNKMAEMDMSDPPVSMDERCDVMFSLRDAMTELYEVGWKNGQSRLKDMVLSIAKEHGWKSMTPPETSHLN